MKEIDIWRAAALLINQHGEDAELHAALHMDEMIERGDPQGEAVWRRITRAMTVLRNTKPASPLN